MSSARGVAVSKAGLRRSPAPGPLTRERIVVAATALIEERGLSGLTMRALGQSLGSSAMALYFHFRCKEDVVDAVATSLVASRPALEAPARAVGPASAAQGRTMAAAFLASLSELGTERPRAFFLVERELAKDAFCTSWRRAFALTPARADLLRMILVAVARALAEHAARRADVARVDDEVQGEAEGEGPVGLGEAALSLFF